MPRPEPIEKEKLILAEGKDAYHFFCHACNFYRETQDVQVMHFGGNDDLPNFLLDLTNMDKYDEVNTIIIARDAETDAKAATDSIKHSMKQATIPVPERPFEYIRNATLKTAFMIFPGPQQKDGTLEDLCLLTVENDPLLECVDGYLECAKAKGEQFPRIHKNRLHCFLAGKDDSVGLPIGLAFKAKVWPPEHPALEPFKRIIQEM
ncbi:MAG: hypothetical protein IIB56_13115 [Planctomycetes bacterium]|nr:hypothetical protein [Planctomycetota bacterium]